jgi:hypothetical protein
VYLDPSPFSAVGGDTEQRSHQAECFAGLSAWETA